MINLALTGSSGPISNCVSARLKRNLWTKITIIANLDCTVSIDLTVFTNPTIISNRNGTFAFNRANYCRPVSDWTPDSTEQFSFHIARKRFRSDKYMVNQKQV